MSDERPIEELIGWEPWGFGARTWRVTVDADAEEPEGRYAFRSHAEVDDLVAWLKAKSGAPYLSIEQPAYDPETWERDWDSTDFHVTMWGEGYAECPIPYGRGATPFAALAAAVRVYHTRNA